MISLGIDLGSSSVKLTVFDCNKGETLTSTFYPKEEMPIISKEAGWAEQKPEDWWSNITAGLKELSQAVDLKRIEAIGITYQMHGLVCIDKEQKVIRPSIIWCDSRAVEIGNKAFQELGEDLCLSKALNSPGNFTASKLKWVKDHEPELFAKIDKVMLPGDYIALRLTGETVTTIPGLSEGIMWDFEGDQPADFLLNYYGIPSDFLPTIVPTFYDQGKVKADVATELGLPPGIPVTYRAGDQPNNAFSLNVLNPGELAATAGTSGVIYGVTDKKEYDPKSRVNIFAHVNHTNIKKRLGVLLCINGSGILNSWSRKHFGIKQYSYEEMNTLASDINIGSDGITMLPFGNGAERVIENKNLGCYINNVQFNIHTDAHLFRAAQEGVAFSLNYGVDIMKEKNGIAPTRMRAGMANMFLSPIFRETLASVCNVPIDLYDTDGAAGAARGAAIGAGYYKNFEEAFSTLKILDTIEPDQKNIDLYSTAYNVWLKELQRLIN